MSVQTIDEYYRLDPDVADDIEYILAVIEEAQAKGGSVEYKIEKKNLKARREDQELYVESKIKEALYRAGWKAVNTNPAYETAYQSFRLVPAI